MPVTVEQEPPNVIFVRVSGKLGSAQWQNAQREVAALLRTRGPSAMLVIAEGFEGWDGTDWGDLSFQLENDRQITRMAIVAPKRWEDQALMFAGQGLRPFEIQYFPPSETAQARAWVTSMN